MGRVQIFTYCFPRGLPPQGFAAGSQKAVSGGFPPVDEEIIQGRLRPVFGHLRSPTAIPGSDARANYEHRADNAITPEGVPSFFPMTGRARLPADDGNRP